MVFLVTQSDDREKKDADTAGAEFKPAPCQLLVSCYLTLFNKTEWVGGQLSVQPFFLVGFELMFCYYWCFILERLGETRLPYWHL